MISSVGPWNSECKGFLFSVLSSELKDRLVETGEFAIKERIAFILRCC